MLWYVLQIAIVLSIAHFYIDVVKTNDTTLHVYFFAYLIAYGITWVLSKSIDLIRSLRRRRPLVERTLLSKRPK